MIKVCSCRAVSSKGAYGNEGNGKGETETEMEMEMENGRYSRVKTSLKRPV